MTRLSLTKRTSSSIALRKPLIDYSHQNRDRKVMVLKIQHRNLPVAARSGDSGWDFLSLSPAFKGKVNFVFALFNGGGKRRLSFVPIRFMQHRSHFSCYRIARRSHCRSC